MADGAVAITKSKMEVWKPKDDAVKVLDDGSEVDKQRGMCYPHIQRNIQKKLKAIAEFEKETLNDIQILLSITLVVFKTFLQKFILNCLFY